MIGIRCDDRQLSILYKHYHEVTEANRCRRDPASGHTLCVRLIVLIPLFLLLRFLPRSFLVIVQQFLDQLRNPILRDVLRAELESSAQQYTIDLGPRQVICRFAVEIIAFLVLGRVQGANSK